MSLKAACIQLNAQSDCAENIRVASNYIREAARTGAKFILTPENTCGLFPDAASKLACAGYEENHPALKALSDLAQELNIYMLAGSLSIKIAPDKVQNRSYLLGPNGRVIAQYNKIHLFDAHLPTGEVCFESEIVTPGNKAVLAQTAFGKVGLTICYDVRFGQLHHSLAQAGAQIIAVPAAFTVPTGQAHWEVLLRARAIETGCFILAPAQTGTHNGTRQTYGHSMIVNPWGEVLAKARQDVGFITATLDLDDVTQARRTLPCLQHTRPFELEIKNEC